ncbi:hypothetical protein IQ249_02060 [Lusitaniella coriacea LEGE 07157]|uniref:Uncharacterized protein n=1 Tax=Lusitaniella coriacea LEGE 07157 TaxID=945747 RepID=A0A8J7AWG0_9CYAN|nr:hypothetical protein [Lusitaniella coriacea]MBE9114672.1 hypothetical protein [Lusitaniella coriacea LEGE 07157]
MNALLNPEFELNSAQELAEYLQSALTWGEIEALSGAYPQWKAEAWELLQPFDRDRVKLLKKWKDYPLAQNFPPYSIVQRLDEEEGMSGKVIDYWSAYGVEYVTFSVGEDIDWCRATHLQRAVAV